MDDPEFTPDTSDDDAPPLPPARARQVAAEREAMLADARDVEFPLAIRGYDRDAVDAYVERVNRIIAELESTRSPEAAVRRALDRVGQETSGVLQRANETAEEIARRSRAQADDRLQAAEREARALREEAEGRVSRLDAELAALWQERAHLVEEVRRLADQLHGVADEAARLGGAPDERPQFVDHETAEVPLVADERSDDEDAERQATDAPDEPKLGDGSEEPGYTSAESGTDREDSPDSDPPPRQ